MQLTVRFDENAKLRVQTVSGNVTVESLVEAIQEVYRRPEFDASHNFVWDFRNCNFDEVSTDMVRQLAMFVSNQWTAKGTPPKGAIVASRDLEYGLARVMSTHLDDQNDFRVFRTLEEAIEWLTS